MNKNKFTSPDTSSAENFWNRFIAFALAIFLLNLWSAHHLGTTIGDLSFINGPLGILAVVSFLAQWLTEKEASDFKTRVRKWFLFFLKPPALIFLYAFLLICSSLVSSVTVLSDGTPGKLTVALTPEGNNQGNEKKEELRGSNDVVRFIDSTTPFGRPFYLEVDGYLRKSFDLYPWVGTKIRVREDLTPLPTVLLRIPTAARMFLSGGSVELYIADTGDGQERRLLNTPTDRGSGALMLGPRLAVPNDIVEKWR
ncbi:hypothetical protein GWN26_13615, partial [Candidatus Saccharibacteria bacterium]|nr:hypothetical protein [Candidatus Saccharibacteria bacterium]NIV04354.1 hypothetical protein [Calditrichia bacterium]NIV72879.1 hypothetical protein [Calditrichia bacterium]NIW00095.1 hypothetical protein [Candidatus Saccharibacteria bacterium]NIW80435.1 hypothetical protein [Calditrichia bacterium]